MYYFFAHIRTTCAEIRVVAHRSGTIGCKSSSSKKAGDKVFQDGRVKVFPGLLIPERSVDSPKKELPGDRHYSH
jgi:hypothetical protein